MAGTILVALDGSPLAEAILPHVVGLARAGGRSVLLFAAVAAPAHAAASSPRPPLQRPNPAPESTALYLERTAARLEQLRLPVSTATAPGSPAQAIASYCREHSEVELVALATHGRSGLPHLLLGSVAEQLLRDAPCPLLLWRPAAPPSGVAVSAAVRYRSILLPLLGEASAERTLTAALELARGSGANIALAPVLSCHDDDNSVGAAAIIAAPTMQALRQRITGAGVAVLDRLICGEPGAAILWELETTRHDLVVLPLDGEAQDNLIMRVARGSGTPILAVPPLAPQ